MRLPQRGLRLGDLGLGGGDLGLGRAGLQQVELGLGRVPLGLGGGDVRPRRPHLVDIGPGEEFVVTGLGGRQRPLGGLPVVPRLLLRRPQGGTEFLLALAVGQFDGDAGQCLVVGLFSVVTLFGGREQIRFSGGNLGRTGPAGQLGEIGLSRVQLRFGGPQVGLR